MVMECKYLCHERLPLNDNHELDLLSINPVRDRFLWGLIIDEYRKWLSLHIQA